MSGAFKVKNVSKTFGEDQILSRVSFDLDKGEKLSLMGPGGCGKTTLLKIIVGLLDADSGHEVEVTLADTDMLHATPDEKQHQLKKVGMAFQQGALFDYMDVGDNLKFAMKHMTSKTADEMDEVVKRLLNAVKLKKTLHMFPYELSGGMQRRVGIARALATDPEVAIFDEPTSGLDPVTSTIILNMIEELTDLESGQSAVICTTNIEAGIRFSDRVVLINEHGKVAADGSWRDLLVDGDDWSKHFLSVRLIGLDKEYAEELDLPSKFMDKHW